MERELNKIYYTPSKPNAFTGIDGLIRATRNRYKAQRIGEWLEGQDVHTLHKQARRRFPRRTYDVYNPYDLWEADLADMKSIKAYNDGYSYLLVVIDALSKFAYVQPIHDKSAKSVALAFKIILDKCDGKHPLILRTDKGTEFTGKEMKELLKRENIVHRLARDPDIKAAIAERFNRTLKGKLWRYFTHKNTKRYIDILPDIIRSYNDSWHSGIRMIPSKVTILNAARARHNLLARYGNKLPLKLPKYKVGDLVRIIRKKEVFSKAYEGDWTLEIFRIYRINTDKQPPVYHLKDLAGEEITGFYYEEELSRVRKDLDRDSFEVDQILDTQGKGRNKKYLVSWVGYPAKFNSWIFARNITDL